MNKDLFLKAAPILQEIQDNGFEAYYVGGAVRDYLMGRPIHDIDITTSASPDEIESIFAHTIPIGKEHGTINVVYNRENYEVTTFRAEGEYEDHRRPNEVIFVRDLYKDVERRDFTINAIAMDNQFNIKDYFNGYTDIQNKLIKTVGNPYERFDEDALRILRGLRFKSQLRFDIDCNTYNAMQEKIADTEYLSIERIIIELRKLLEGTDASVVYPLLNELQFFKYVPFFNSFDTEDIKINEPIKLEMLIAIMLFKQPSNISLSKLKISNDSKKEIQKYITILKKLPEIQTKKALKVFVYDYGISILSYILDMRDTLAANQIKLGHPLIFNIKTINDINQNLIIHQRSDMMVNGKDILESLNLKGGPWLKNVLREIECAIINQEIPNQKSEIINWVRTHVEI
ncbi:CCA tRNA nucleotidyltransferase [Staphylococcus condimenti]|uniref:CCA-adding enzyme n=5 Tax=Staphylococcus condimenti TaxID=70255 RepID=A0AB37H1P0_9STAP|nr:MULTISPECIES: CCA tRNA nucleotidyltransferase [Staphylococcus]AMY04763.1 CCA tRNA nucleotidyltransferase [Staphylococcus condimenti]APR61004.1 CCA tRNA nucleotidyltransferase [Staphylococcus condimenti]MDK8644032.1 CCA tRNA nucleotidyltransferase [Staphylococcus condimenti]OFP01352.1 CCA tRNA nucleotidyltransferase [Staphylococcus sp. HMSC065E08]PNZ65440.1 CCA tRNA nucleotidyltransferase [Staphylococcus condimenti]